MKSKFAASARSLHHRLINLSETSNFKNTFIPRGTKSIFNAVFWPSTLALRKKSFEGIFRGSNFSWKTKMYEACIRVVDDTRPRALGFKTHKAQIRDYWLHVTACEPPMHITSVKVEYQRHAMDLLSILAPEYDKLIPKPVSLIKWKPWGIFYDIDAMGAFSNSGYLIQFSAC